MIPKNVEPFLRASLEDRRLSRGERRALRSLFHDWKPTEGQITELRSIAFRLAREAVVDAHAAATFEWLEDIVQLLQSSSVALTTTTEACFSPGDECPQRIAGLFRTARRSADVCVFTITDNSVTRAIIDAHQRGVAVRVISDDDKQFDRGSDIERLRDEGIPTRTDRTDKHMHHKFAIFDQSSLLTGSYNWTRSAARDNEENFIITDDRRLISAFSGEFETLWERFGDAV